MAEEFIEASGCNYLIFRTAWLYSEYGNNFVKTMMRLFDTKKEVNVVNDQIGTPTYAGNLAGLIVGIIERKEPLEGEETIPLLKNGIYHFTDEGVASWYDFAWQVYEHSGKFGVRLNGVTTREYGSNTKRPYYSVLDKTKVKTDFKGLYEPKHWHNGVYEVVTKLLEENNER
jgi:dTDP-4-dehydrorhamnose reductase